MYENFETFLEHSHKDLPKEVVASTWWNTIANRVYIPSSAQEGSICSPIHRLIHRLVASTINMHKDDDKVPTLDIFYMWSIITTDIFCNLPYCLAKYLAEGAVKERITSKINGGMFFTKLARTYGILDQGAARVLTMIPSPPFSTTLFRRERIIEDYGGGNFRIQDEDALLEPK